MLEVEIVSLLSNRWLLFLSHAFIYILLLSFSQFCYFHWTNRMGECASKRASERTKKWMERKVIAKPNYNSLTILYTYSTWFSLALNWLTSWLELVNVFCKWMNIVCNNLIPPQNFGQIQDEHLILNWFHRWNDNGGHKIHRKNCFSVLVFWKLMATIYIVI